MSKISVVINTYNEEKRIARALASVKNFASDVVVVDMMSSDKTREIARKNGARVFKHKKLSYVEPARNFAIGKAKHDWIFILDADEQLGDALKVFIKNQIKKKDDPGVNYYRVPRKNIIFGKWVKHTGWWPDYNIRLFKKGTVDWHKDLHSIPLTVGKGVDLPVKEEMAIKHMNYSSLEEYVARMNRYTTIQSKELNKKGIEFKWRDVVLKPASEFMRRFFAEQGFKDGLHGLALSLLQAFSELVIYLKLWQKQKFKRRKIDINDLTETTLKVNRDFSWWKLTTQIDSEESVFKKLWLKILRRILSV